MDGGGSYPLSITYEPSRTPCHTQEEVRLSDCMTLLVNNVALHSFDLVLVHYIMFSLSVLRRINFFTPQEACKSVSIVEQVCLLLLTSNYFHVCSVHA